MKKNRNSEKLFNEALNFIPGGVNSPVRSFKAVSGNPRYIKKAYGAYIEDDERVVKRFIGVILEWNALPVTASD